MTTYFYVHASNIHTDDAHSYGPFPGNPALTYEFLRCFGDDAPGMDGAHIFAFNEERTDAHFHTGDGQRATWGWRRCHDGEGSFGNERGPIWTDLMIEPHESDAPVRPLTNNRPDINDPDLPTYPDCVCNDPVAATTTTRTTWQD